ncbi:GH3 family domain-containing protein [Dehalogenimonas alkenigignens]|uniref:GH3 auxin-responsive promoter n=1 Tax=Dehalogenimonas alkenigignens TaxID=1217799 RepID=A0A0W0GHP0_9CHLR|nr:GH3 auxin-responsive promoter family protein [Dehalogenimonas alkenigignens]KTB48076.1 GH3 auxin-responsive promoter [Dehalogenimonas alkenigignens]PVV84329.1 GH3 auxin-responsive promoter [Dehalogenimonas alkenigignens]
MSQLSELFRQGKYEEMWDRCCGFIDLSLPEFMNVQKRLLLEQLELLKNCQLGRGILKGANPTTVEEFRKMVPLTSYEDYAPYLLKRRWEVLPRKPILWQYTSGKSSEYSYRWAPVTARMLDETEALVFALSFFSSATKRRDIKIRPGDRVLYGMAPPPYATGTMTRVFPHEMFDFLPPVSEAEQASFEDRINTGFKMGLDRGMDYVLSMSSVAYAIGERFKHNGGSVDIKKLVRKPKTLARLVKGKLAARLAGRKMLPRDLWKLKGLITYGIDGEVFRDKIKEMWGRYPLDFHGCTEAPVIAMQTWDHQGMTFIPHLNFFEFIPEAEAIKCWQDPAYQPQTFLMDELKPGNYELVITNLHGGAFVRYRLGHLVQITSMRNDKLDIDIPQMRFLARVDDQIDIAGFTRLSEKVIWKALENSGVEYEEWTARKEVVAGKPELRIYVELKKNESRGTAQIADAVHAELKQLDTPYAELEEFTGLRPIEVTVLPHGAFKLYKMKQQAAGAELAHLKPPHLNANDAIIEFLTSTARTVRVAEAAPVAAAA